MRLPRRRPRSVYRVYAEDDYLAGAEPLPDWEADAQAADVPPGDVAVPSGGVRIAEIAATAAADARVTDVEASKPAVLALRRFVVGAALAGAVVLVGGSIATAILTSRPAVHRGLAPRVLSAPSAATAQASRAASPRVRRASAAERRFAQPRRPLPRRRGKAHTTSSARVVSGPRSGPRSRPKPAAVEPGAPVSAPASSGPIPAAVEPGAPGFSRPVPAVVESAAPGSSGRGPAVEVAPIAAPPAPPVTPVTAIAPESAAAHELAPSSRPSAQIEFGFERR